MKIDFIHIGYHKTASTYLQFEVFPSINGLVVLNHLNKEMDNWFYNNFINVNSHSFCKDSFLKNFKSMILECGQCELEDSIRAISEENLSGDIYTGMESKELMRRIYDVFGDTMILIVIRNQIDFILSVYSNYVLHGGTMWITSWLRGQETRFGLLFEKIKYSSLIADYMATFGQKNVYVMQYEKLFDEREGIKAFLSLFGLDLPDVKRKRVNPGTSLWGNRLMALLNTAGLYRLRGRQRIFSLLRSNNNTRDREYVKSLIDDRLQEVYEDNRKVEALIGKRLMRVYYE